MSHAIAIRSIITNPDGSVDVAYSVGETAASVPAAPDGYIRFGAGQADLQREIADLHKTVFANPRDFVLLHLGMTWLQANGTFRNPSQVLNKTVIFDPTAANALRIV